MDDAMIALCATALVKKELVGYDFSQLDLDYAVLSAAEKQTIIGSLLNGDDAAKKLILAKIKSSRYEKAMTELTGYIAANSFPSAVVADILNFLEK